MPTLILVRHGESRWNSTGRFTGWVDVPLNEQGIKESLAAAGKLKKIPVHIGFVSKLKRAQDTLNMILAHQQRTGIFLHTGEKKQEWYSCDHHTEKTEILVHTTTLLNERYYGTLQGLYKQDVRKKYGEAQVIAWRRGYNTRPPGGGESLQDVYKRVIPFFLKNVVPQLRAQKNVIVASHGNTIRVIVKYLEKISTQHLPNLNLPFGQPLLYDYHNGLLRRKTKGSITFDRPLMWSAKKNNT